MIFRNKFLKLGALASFFVFGLYACGSDDVDDGPAPCTPVTWYQDADGDGLGNPAVTLSACDQPEGYVSNANDDDDTDDGSTPDNAGEDLSLKLNGSDVIMQAFYWDCAPVGEWYKVIGTKIPNWSEVGVGKIWLPSPAKAGGGSNSMGYDPYDYFDVGEFDQKGTVETRFGSRAELENLIDDAHNADIEVLADIVIGHNHGADAQEVNGVSGETNWTNFAPASGKFNRTWEDFHPNSTHNGYDEENIFFAENDLCHEVPNVQNWLWKNEDSVAKFYMNELGFDGWRFDYVKSFNASWIKEWMNEVGGFGVGEYWDGNKNTLKNWIDGTGATTSAFDFATFYVVQDALDNNNLHRLEDHNMLWKDRPFEAVTFMANHDTEKDSNTGNYIEPANKSLAYAYLLTHEGYPCLFYQDYESNKKEEIANLVLIHNSIAYGTTDILYADNNEYIMRRNGGDGHPGLILYMSFTGSESERTISVNWDAGQTLVDYSGNMEDVLTVNGDQTVTVKSPAGRSYAIWSLQDF